MKCSAWGKIVYFLEVQPHTLELSLWTPLKSSSRPIYFNFAFMPLVFSISLCFLSSFLFCANFSLVNRFVTPLFSDSDFTDKKLVAYFLSPPVNSVISAWKRSLRRLSQPSADELWSMAPTAAPLSLQLPTSFFFLLFFFFLLPLSPAPPQGMPYLDLLHEITINYGKGKSASTMSQSPLRGEMHQSNSEVPAGARIFWSAAASPPEAGALCCNKLLLHHLYGVLTFALTSLLFFWQIRKNRQFTSSHQLTRKSIRKGEKTKKHSNSMPAAPTVI